MKKVVRIAVREFVATAITPGFVIGLLIVPVVVSVMALFVPRMLSQRAFRAQGQIAIVDPTGAVAAELRKAVDPAFIARDREQNARRTLAQLPEGVRRLADGGAPGAMDAALGQIPDLRIVDGPWRDVQEAKDWLRQAGTGVDRHLALVVIHADAVTPKPGNREFGAYELYEPMNLDERIEGMIQQSVRRSIVAARSAAQNLDRDRIEQLLFVDRVRAVTLGSDGEEQMTGRLNRMIPVAFMTLLFMGVVMGGQTLMTSTIEEKSSRVAEVLLSAVSPLELMAGKIMGQMAVGMTAIALYVLMGLALLVSFAVLGFLDFSLLFYLGVFFILTYLTLGSLMAAIGAAVNELNEAQSLMGPLMLVLILPMAMIVPIVQNPNSTFSTLVSFVPPVNTFAMLLRMSSTAPPPLWQVWLSIGVAAVGALGAIWFSSKVFRIGLLMYGKPPNFATLVRWVRAA